MDIVIIGSGNVAHHLAGAFSKQGIKISQLFGRNERALNAISREFDIPWSTTELKKADLYLIAVSDNSVQEVSARITDGNCLVAHTSGSLPIGTLKGNYRKASFYPLQTFSKTRAQDYSKIPFFIESENIADFILLKDLALKISDKVLESNYETRKYIHITAIFACNFVNHLFARAKEMSDRQNIPFSYFKPLIEETFEKIGFMEPKDAQTGPAVRNDQRVLSLHEELLEGMHLEIYKTMNKSIKEMYEL